MPFPIIYLGKFCQKCLFSYFSELLLYDWHLLHCPVPVNPLSSFRTGPSTKSPVPRNIFIFNCTLDANPFKLFRCICGRAKAFSKFQQKSYEDVCKISKYFFQIPHGFHIECSCIQHIREGYHNLTTRLWSDGIVVIQLD